MLQFLGVVGGIAAIFQMIQWFFPDFFSSLLKRVKFFIGKNWLNLIVISLLLILILK